MRYLSVCSGIEAATVAWHNLGWTPVGFSEIEPFPSAVLAHHVCATIDSHRMRVFAGISAQLDADPVAGQARRPMPGWAAVQSPRK